MRLLGWERGKISEKIRMLLTGGLMNSRWAKTIDTTPRSTSLIIISSCLLTLSLTWEIEMFQTGSSVFSNFLLSFI